MYIIFCNSNVFIMWKRSNKSCELGIKYVNEAIKSNLNLEKELSN